LHEYAELLLLMRSLLFRHKFTARFRLRSSSFRLRSTSYDGTRRPDKALEIAENAEEKSAKVRPKIIRFSAFSANSAVKILF